MSEQRSISIVVPGLNEERNIAAVIQGLTGAFAQGGIDWELLVFDDGSSDNTFKIASGFTQADPRVRVFRNEINRGIGYCFKEGIRHSCCSHITFFPGDNQGYPEDLYRLSLNLPKAQVLIAVPLYRRNDRSLLRRIISRVLTAIFTSFIAVRLAHVTNAVIYDKDLASGLDIRCNGFMFQIEALLKAFRSAKSIFISKERIPIRPREHGQTKAVRLRTLLELFYLMWVLSSAFLLTHRNKFSSRPILLS